MTSTYERRGGVQRWHVAAALGALVLAAFASLFIGVGDLTPADLLHDLGARLFTIGIGGPDYDLSRVEQWVRWRDGLNG